MNFNLPNTTLKFSLLLSVLFILSYTINGQVIFSEDFSNYSINGDGFGSVPNNFTLIDVDGQTPNANNATGFLSDVWMLTNRNGGDTAAISTSWFTSVVQADRYLVLPQLNLVTNNQLRWNAKSQDSLFLETYEVRISTTTATASAFLANPALATIVNEPGTFTAHSVNIPANYDNQSVYFAFRNRSTDEFWINIDDIEVEINMSGGSCTNDTLTYPIDKANTANLYGAGSGYAAGTNNVSLEVGQYYNATGTVQGVSIWFGAKEIIGAADSYWLKVYDSLGSDSLPTGSAIDSISISSASIDTSSQALLGFNDFVFNNQPSVSGGFVITLEVDAANKNDTLGMVSSGSGDALGTRTAVMKFLDGTWFKFDDMWLIGGNPIDLDIFMIPVVCISGGNPCNVSLTETGNTPNTSCGVPNGSFAISPSGGSPPYTYTDGSTTNNTGSFTSYSGAYSVTVTDNAGCTQTASGTVANNQPTISVSETANSDNTSCTTPNGSYTVLASGGSNPYTYNNGSTTNSNGAFSGVFGPYNVTVTDGNNCTGTISGTVANNQASISVSETANTANTACGSPNGSFNVTASGGSGPYTYYNGSTTNNDGIFTAVVGAYSVSVTDANGCIGSASVTVADNQPIISINETANTANTSCGTPNGSYTLLASGGLGPYTYNDGSATNNDGIFTAVVGAYGITVTDATGCTAVTGGNVVDNAPTISVSQTATTPNTSCVTPNGTYIVTVSGGSGPYTYNNGSTTNNDGIFTAVVGAYSVTVTDANSCTGTVSGSVVDNSPTVTLSQTATTPNTSCGSPNGSYTVTASGGSGSYSYTDGSTANSNGIFTGVVGAYSVTVGDNNGCTATTSGTVVDNAATVSISETANTSNTSCNTPNGSYNVTASTGSGPYTYNNGLSTNSNGIFSAVVGAYSVTVTDASGCTGTVSGTVADNAPIIVVTEVPSSKSPNTSCDGNNPNGAVSIAATGGSAPYTYTNTGNGSSNTNGVFTGLLGSIAFNIVDASGCTGSITISILDNSGNLTITESAKSPNTNCSNPNGSVTLSTSGGNTPYTYTDGSTTGPSNQFSGLDGGSYGFTVTDATGCTGSINVTINDNTSSPSISVSTVDETSSGTNDGSAVAQATGGTPNYTYLWSNGQSGQSITGLSGGAYSITVTDANGCTEDAGFTVGTGVGIDDIEALINFSLYPNPSEGIVTINAELNDAYEIKIEWYNIAGKQLITREYSNVLVINDEFDLSGFAKGIYLTKVTVDNSVIIKKVVLK